MRSLLRRESLRLAEATLEQTLETLVAFLRAEQFAVVTYDAALGRVKDIDAHEELGRLKLSHVARALILCERVREFGGASDDESDSDTPEPWGAFAAVIGKVRSARDEAHVIAALREGECWAVRDYELDLRDVEFHLRRELARLLLGEQRRTRGRLLRLVARTMLSTFLALRHFGHPAASESHDEWTPDRARAVGPGGGAMTRRGETSAQAMRRHRNPTR